MTLLTREQLMAMQKRLDSLQEPSGGYDVPTRLTPAMYAFSGTAPEDIRVLLAEIERERWLLNKANQAIGNVAQWLQEATPPGSINPNSPLFTGLMVAQGLLEDWQKTLREESGNVG